MPDSELRDAERTAEHYRRLAAVDPDRHLADLGTALYNLGAVLTRHPDRFDELDAVLREDIEVRRRLGVRQDLAESLNHYAMGLGLHGRRAEAHDVVREAVVLYRELATTDRAYLPLLAAALANLGNQLAELGRRAEAVAVTRESAAIRERLPDAAAHASALADLGLALSDLGDHEEAAAKLKAAVDRYRGLPDGHSFAYWATLVGLEQELTKLGRADEARPVREEAATLYREFARDNPEFITYSTALFSKNGITVSDDGEPTRVSTDQLNDHGLRLASEGRFDEAIAVLRDVEARCRAADSKPGLAKAFHNLGLVHAWRGDPAAALAATERAVGLHRELLDRPLLADSLHSLGNRLAALARHREALAATEESVALYREIADPAGLARSVNSLGIRYCDNDRHEEALKTTEEAVALQRKLDSPTGLATALANLALRHARLDRLAEVPGLTTEAVDIVNTLDDSHPSDNLAGLAESLAWLGWYLKKHGHRRQARAATKAATVLRRG
ncbi:tetratricopeptide repeat protein [Actinokineospora sp. HUAS TT18]|uniref:tetratricopeptide repeat protein n=1 Tax=Actinokineospora sp. HUAS TT18 TaxID=3447451 RepID=UPI003F523C85